MRSKLVTGAKLQLACLLILCTSAAGIEVTGTIGTRVRVVGPPYSRVIGVEGASIRFISESNPGESYSDSTDIEGRFLIDLDDPDTAVESENSAKPVVFRLNQNYPNPFNPGTVISYELLRAVNARVVIYNSIGQRMRSLVDEYQEHGSHAAIWDGRDDEGRPLASGVYIYRMTAGWFSETRKMVLIDGLSSSARSNLPLIMADGGRSARDRILSKLADVERIEGVPLPRAASKLAQLRSFMVTVDAYKMVPFDQPGIAMWQDTVLNFLMEGDEREGVVFLKEGQRQLFLDDYSIEEMSGLTRTMHQPQKKGAVIRPNWPEWPATEAEAALSTRSAPFWDPLEEVFKLWLRDGSYRTSADGLHWIPGPEGFNGGEVFFDPLDPDPARRYKLFNPRRMAASPDGRNWTTLDVTITSSDEWNFSIDLATHGTAWED